MLSVLDSADKVFVRNAGDRTTTLAKALYDATHAAIDAGFTGYLLMLDEAQVLRDETDRNGQPPNCRP